MRILLIFANILLAGILAYGAFTVLGSSSGGETLRLRKRSEQDGSASLQKPAKLPDASTESVRSGDLAGEDAELFVSHNIFDVARCPGARVMGRTASNVQLTMTLAGTFEAGNLRGAIILQKDRSLNEMQNQQYWMAQRAIQAQQQQQTSRTSGGTRTANSPQTNDPRFVQSAARARFGANAEANSADVKVYKQYVRVGETLANGYTLAEITRNSATLTKGSERLELEMPEASKNISTTSSSSSSSSSAGQSSQNYPMNPMMMGPPPGMNQPNPSNPSSQNNPRSGRSRGSGDSGSDTSVRGGRR